MKRPPFTEFPQLRSERILLRELVASDLPANIEITFFNRVPATSLEEALLKQQQVHERYLAGDGIHWERCRRDRLLHEGKIQRQRLHERSRAVDARFWFQ